MMIADAIAAPAQVAWYAVWTRVRHEQVVHRQLVRKNIDAFLPTVARWSRWKDRRKRIDWPLFPGYCFARFDPCNRLPVLTCAGVLNIVSVEGAPAPIPDFELNNLRLLVESKLQCDPCAMLTEGDRVEIVDGALRGVVGTLLRKEAGRATVVLSVDLIAQGVRLEVDAAGIRPV